jgi:hypothetical protein
MSEENGTGNVAPGADDATNETTETTATEAENTGELTTDDTNPDTGKLYTQAEIDDREAKLRKSLEKKYEKRIARELEKFNSREPEAITEPRPEDYPDVNAYNKALVKYEVAQERLHSQYEEMKAQQAEVGKAFYADIAKAPGFDPEITVDIRDWAKGEAFAEAIIDSPHRVKIIEHLCLNEEDRDKFDAMSDSRKAAWIGRMEEKFEKKPNAATDAKPVVRGGGSTTTLYKTDPGKLAMDDWYAQRQKEGRYGGAG